jgi:4-hydroxyphenylpyruvate dioxygenase
MATDAMRSLLVLRDQLAPGSIPPATPLHGYAFVELAVEPASVGETQRLLHAMGFAPHAQHRTKPVTLWRQGGARILLNAAAPRPPGVVAIAVETGDPPAAAARAEALLAPILDRRRAPGEADLAAVAAPDGTSVFFCRTEATGWLEDFEALEPAADGDTEIDRVDHVALSQPFDFFDEAVLFFRTVLGLEARESLEFAAPDGLVRSRAVANRDGSVRFALTVPVLAHGDGQAAEQQHVALACADVFAVARRMAERGAPPLAIPGNYYDDLAARTDLDDELVDRMRELGVLYDRDARGELLHVYTPVVGGRVFFEVVERRAAYDGFGAANTPVRMAAHRAGGAANGA